MRIVLLLLSALTLSGADTIQAFGHRWKVPIGADWNVAAVDGIETLQMLVPRPSTQPRRPTQFALAETPDYRRVVIEAEVRKEPLAQRNRRTSVIIVYAYRDENHFNYAHLSVDSGAQVDVHNGIFHVYGGDRVRISSTDGPAAFTSEDWHRVRLEWDGGSGRVTVAVNGRSLPSLEAIDMSLRRGRVGLGSFFDLGEFRRVTIRGDPAP